MIFTHQTGRDDDNEFVSEGEDPVTVTLTGMSAKLSKQPLAHRPTRACANASLRVLSPGNGVFV